MDKHVTFIATLNIALGLLGLFAGTVLFIIIAGGGLLGGLLSHEALPIMITGAVGSAVGIAIMVTSLPAIIGGLGLLKRRPWARIMMLIISVLGLFNIPFGTALALYTIWALMQDETVVMFSV